MTTPYYKKDFELLEPYERLAEYNLCWADYLLDPSTFILDWMNFAPQCFDEVFTIEEIKSISPILPSYGSPDGSYELGALVKALERARLERQPGSDPQAVDRMIAAMDCGLAAGCAQTMSGVIHSIVRLLPEEYGRANASPEIITHVPNYTVYLALLSQLSGSLQSRILHSRPENKFLPTFDEFRALVSDNTIAFVLTYPGNPAQVTYEGPMLNELRQIVAYCQEQEIFLIVDNIYQDTLYGNGRMFSEVFAMTDSPDFIIKIYGSSKDTPFFPGYRTGYWIGDPRIVGRFRYWLAANSVSLPTLSLAFFALNMYFKRLQVAGDVPRLEHMEAFRFGAFGDPLTAPPADELYDRFISTDLYTLYSQRIKKARSLQDEAVQEVKRKAAELASVRTCINDDIGNVALFRVAPDVFPGNDHELFELLIEKAGVFVLPGNIFGMPTIKGDAWFRCSLVQYPVERIIDGLERADRLLLKRSSGARGPV